jgi:hypothetical protein
MGYRTAVVVLVGLRLMAGRGAWAQQELSAATIVAEMQTKNDERQRELEGYTGERTYRVEYHGTGGEHHGEMRASVVYDEHGEKHITVISETGSKLICERVLRKMIETEESASSKGERAQMMLSAENYSFELLGQERVDGVESWVMRVEPKMDNKLTYRGRIWVSENDFAVVRVQGEPAKSPSWWINRASFDWRFSRHGRFWLPERSVAVSHVRIGGEAKLTIEYGDYRIAQERREERNVQLAQHTATR